MIFPDTRTLPSGMTEVAQSGLKLRVYPEKIPWLQKPEEVSLAHIHLQSGVEFYCGSMIRHPDLITAASGLDSQGRKGSHEANNLFYSQIQAFVTDRQSKRVFKLCDPSTDCDIFYVKNKDGLRVYFICPAEIEGKPAIIRVAACQNKCDQKKVLSKLAGNRNKRV